MSTAAQPQPGQQPNQTEDAINTATQVGGAIAQQFCPPNVSRALSVALGVEPEVVHAIFSIAALFHRGKHPSQQPQPAK